ncbi:MAG: hypothetical protein HC769_09255 [Cyanobacteria bacterium CRU_2_1]|nr:hypothetical protein [Cyanobacteria bacterium RU_5_0]NJR59016.1 hypothetical protein [Cyanobacteria bacterium CRU_2_1]
MTIALHPELNDDLAIASALSKEFAATAVERDRQADIPKEEIERLREMDSIAIGVTCEPSRCTIL